MTEKKIKQKFKADFKGFFSKLKGATAVPAAAVYPRCNIPAG